MIDQDSINEKIRLLIKTVLELPDGYVRPANRNAPTNSDPFATVYIVTSNDTGLPNVKDVNEPEPSNNVAETLENQVKITVSVQFFRGAALGLIKKLGLLLRSSMAVQQMNNLGLGLIKASNARDLTQMIDAGWEPRAQMDIEFHVINAETVSVPTFGRFPFEINTENETEQTNFEVLEP
jgi:hypothetical protein